MTDLETDRVGVAERIGSGLGYAIGGALYVLILFSVVATLFHL